MSITKIDKFTQDQATEYADTEARLKGFTRGGEKWKNAVRHYLSFAMSTMAVGRNPRNESGHYKIVTEEYADVFGENGFAGRMLKGLRASVDKEANMNAVRARILSSVHNLMKLFEAGGLGIKNTTSGGGAGHIENSEMSQLQFPNKSDFASEEEYRKAADAVILNWFIRDMITDCILESLSMFFRLKAEDVQEILAGVTINEDDIKTVMTTGRREYIKRLRAQVRHKVDQLNYKKLVLNQK